MALFYLEGSSDGGPSPSTSKVSVRAAKDSAVYHIEAPSIDDLQNLYTDLLGDVAVDPNKGKPGTGTVTFTGVCTVNGLTMTNLQDFTVAPLVGMVVTKPQTAFPVGATIFSVDSPTQITISQPATVTQRQTLTVTFSTIEGAGRLIRTLPKAHPVFQYRYVSDVGMYGVGVPALVNAKATNPSLGARAVTPLFSLYPKYNLQLEFAPRMYAVLPDNAVKSVTTTPANFTAGQLGSWYDQAGAQQTFTYVNEWVRFTDFEIMPQQDFITAQVGAGMIFRATGSVNGNVFVGMPRIYIPNRILKIIWYMVPYRYVTSANSYLNKYIGQINQNDWWNWKAGELLYLNYNPTRYQPPVPKTELHPWVPLFPGLGGPKTVSQAKLVDLELIFLLTKRTATDAPTPFNGNYVAKGHNLLPWYKDRKFHYATTADDPATVTINGQTTAGSPVFSGLLGAIPAPNQIVAALPDGPFPAGAKVLPYGPADGVTQVTLDQNATTTSGQAALVGVAFILLKQPKPDPTLGTPSFFSFPVEILFMDPDAPNTGGV